MLTAGLAPPGRARRRRRRSTAGGGHSRDVLLPVYEVFGTALATGPCRPPHRAGGEDGQRHLRRGGPV